MKPDKNFRLDRSVKRMLSTIVDDNDRNDIKRIFISAQLVAERTRRKNTSKNSRSETENE